jgi:hypothetical protein
MDLSVPREIDAPSVIADEVAGETLVISLNTGNYYVIPPAALGVWNALSSGVPAQALLAAADDPRAPALVQFLTVLVEAGLLREAQRPESGAAVTWAAEDLRIEEHTDMADLLGLDPIHDADESFGWPMRREH